MKLKQLRCELDKGNISAVELTKEYLDLIKKDTTNSFITVCEERALNDAVKAQEMIDKGAAKALTGIPVSVKDNICTRGIRTTCASRMLEDFVPQYDAEAVAKLKDQNAVILGKTNMDEFAMGSTSVSSYFGAVKNPLNEERVAGGSSGGSAAAVGAGLCPVSLASDTGGSVRQPAGFCGVVGIKPTYGRISRYGVVSYASSLEQIGVVAQTAEDAGYVLSNISGSYMHDMTCRLAAEDFTRNCGMSLKGFRIGIIDQLFECCSPEVSQSVLRALDVYKSMGAEIIKCSMPSLDYAVAAYYIISAAEASSNLARFDGVKYGKRADDYSDYDQLVSRSRAEGFGFEVKKRILLGNYVLSAEKYEEYYIKANKIRAQIKREYEEIFRSCSCIITPTTSTTAGLIDGNNSGDAQYYGGDMSTVSANMAELPAISIPCGKDSDCMPIGMSITGPALSEALIIGVADAYEREGAR